MVQEKGLEPPLPFGNWILNPARLPIPPLLHSLFMLSGGLHWTRTNNPQIKSLLLCQIELAAQPSISIQDEYKTILPQLSRKWKKNNIKKLASLFL